MPIADLKLKSLKRLKGGMLSAPRPLFLQAAELSPSYSAETSLPV